jgi:hypothetical protein
VREGVRLTAWRRVRLDFHLRSAPRAECDGYAGVLTSGCLRKSWAGCGFRQGRRPASQGRSFVTLAQLSPGVALPPTRRCQELMGAVHGQMNISTTDLRSSAGRSGGFHAVIDSIQNSNRINSPSAEFGRFNGGVVNLTMKSVQITSTVPFLNSFEMKRSMRAMCSRPQPANQQAEFRRNQYGFVLGGPVLEEGPFSGLSGQPPVDWTSRTSTVPTWLRGRESSARQFTIRRRRERIPLAQSSGTRFSRTRFRPDGSCRSGTVESIPAADGFRYRE